MDYLKQRHSEARFYFILRVGNFLTYVPLGRMPSSTAGEDACRHNISNAAA